MGTGGWLSAAARSTLVRENGGKLVPEFQARTVRQRAYEKLPGYRSPFIVAAQAPPSPTSDRI